MELTERLRRETAEADWIVLAAQLPVEESLELIAAVHCTGVPILVVEPDPSRLEHIRQGLEAEGLGAVNLSSQLLASEAGEQCWYRYNDPRQSGTTPPEQLQAHLPNLQLESLELRPTRTLATVLDQWVPQGTESEGRASSGFGLLLVTGGSAASQLAGAGAWLERLNAVLVIDPPAVDTDLVAVLASGALALEASGPSTWLWRRSPLMLLTRQHNHLAAECQQLGAERNSLLAEREQWWVERQQLESERNDLRAEREALTTTHEQGLQEREQLITERDHLRAELELQQMAQRQLEAQKDELERRLDHASAQLNEFITILSGVEDPFPSPNDPTTIPAENPTS